MSKIRLWVRKFLFNLIKEDIQLMIDGDKPPQPIKLEWTKPLIDFPKATKVISWQAHPSLPDRLLVVYERPDGRRMKETVKPQQEGDSWRPMDEYLLSLPQARL